MTTQSQPSTKRAWVFDSMHSSAEFAIKHMMFMTVRGRSSKIEADIAFDESQPERSSLDARIGVASIDTREPGRDAHLLSADFFDAEKYPVITFKSRRIEPHKGGRYAIVGDLTIRDITREVVFDTEFGGIAMDPWGNQRAGFSAEASINRKDFGLTWNVALETGGVVVGETVKVSLEAELVKQLAK